MLTFTTRIVRAVTVVACGLGMLSTTGCNQPTLFANPDPNLRKDIPQLKADAAKRFPYKDDAPKAFEPQARAQVGYDLHRVEVVHFANEDWSNVDVWVNRQYVCHIPVMQSRQLKQLAYKMLINELGQTFPEDNSIPVQTVEIYRNGTMYSVVCHPGEY
ncbi:MAG TPA: hypothetical protein VHP11_05230 [Tepidisphaeraceae bacterium]|nr:hypothetical protein [Tepidisphaeraceae bacterium]